MDLRVHPVKICRRGASGGRLTSRYCQKASSAKALEEPRLPQLP